MGKKALYPGENGSWQLSRLPTTHLLDRADALMEALREAENRGWHHFHMQTPEYQEFLRIAKEANEVDDILKARSDI